MLIIILFDTRTGSNVPSLLVIITMDKIMVAMVIKKLNLLSTVEIFLSGSKGSNQGSNKV